MPGSVCVLLLLSSSPSLAIDRIELPGHMCASQIACRDFFLPFSRVCRYLPTYLFAWDQQYSELRERRCSVGVLAMRAYRRGSLLDGFLMVCGLGYPRRVLSGYFRTGRGRGGRAVRGKWPFDSWMSCLVHACYGWGAWWWLVTDVHIWLDVLGLRCTVLVMEKKVGVVLIVAPASEL